MVTLKTHNIVIKVQVNFYYFTTQNFRYLNFFVFFTFTGKFRLLVPLTITYFVSLYPVFSKYSLLIFNH